MPAALRRLHSGAHDDAFTRAARNPWVAAPDVPPPLEPLEPLEPEDVLEDEELLDVSAFGVLSDFVVLDEDEDVDSDLLSLFFVEE